MTQFHIVPDHFDIFRWIKKYREYIPGNLHPDYAISWIKEPGDIPQEIPIRKLTPKFFKESLESGTKLFFHFAGPFLGEPFPCGDGVIRYPYVADDESEEMDETMMLLSDSDSLGFLFGMSDGWMTVDTAIYFGGGCPVPPPSIEGIEDAWLFDEIMAAFLKEHIKEVPGKRIPDGGAGD